MPRWEDACRVGHPFARHAKLVSVFGVFSLIDAIVLSMIVVDSVLWRIASVNQHQTWHPALYLIANFSTKTDSILND